MRKFKSLSRLIDLFLKQAQRGRIVNKLPTSYEEAYPDKRTENIEDAPIDPFKYTADVEKEFDLQGDDDPFMLDLVNTSPQDDFPTSDNYQMPNFDDLFQSSPEISDLSNLSEQDKDSYYKSLVNDPHKMTEGLFKSMPPKYQQLFIRNKRFFQRINEESKDVKKGLDFVPTDIDDTFTSEYATNKRDRGVVPKEIQEIIKYEPELRGIVYKMLTHFDEDTVRYAKKRFNELKRTNPLAKEVAKLLKTEEQTFELNVDEEDQRFMDMRDQFLEGIEKSKSDRQGISSGIAEETDPQKMRELIYQDMMRGMPEPENIQEISSNLSKLIKDESIINPVSLEYENGATVYKKKRSNDARVVDLNNQITTLQDRKKELNDQWIAKEIRPKLDAIIEERIAKNDRTNETQVLQDLYRRSRGVSGSQGVLLSALKNMAENGHQGAQEFVDKIAARRLREIGPLSGSSNVSDNVKEYGGKGTAIDADLQKKQLERFQEEKDAKSKETEERERAIKEFQERKTSDTPKIQKSKEKLRSKREYDKKKEDFSKLSLTEINSKLNNTLNELKGLFIEGSKEPREGTRLDGFSWITPDAPVETKISSFLVRPGKKNKFIELYNEYLEIYKLMGKIKKKDDTPSGITARTKKGR